MPKEARLARIFDAHVHLWSGDLGRYPRAEVPGLPFREFDGSAETLLALMDAHGVARTLIVQSPWYAGDNSYVRDTVAAHPDRFAAIGCLPLAIPDSAFEGLEREVGRDGFRGIRVHLVRDEALAQARAGRFDRIFARADELALPVCILYRAAEGHEFVARMARAHRDLPIVVDHCAYATPAFKNEAHGLLELARHPRVHVKLAIHHQLSSEAYPWRDLHQLHRDLVASFGAKRLLWGSNFPMFMPGPTYTERLEAVSRHMPFLTEDDLSAILWETAASLWPADAP
ncbi:MAG: amidohydrolase [Alphaproteobacteria bacterium]|nr:amidohydrolase [Alphaproteobacteria bacterium]